MQNPVEDDFLPPSDPLVADLVSKLDDNLREAFEERAGIIEFDANLPRAHAECLALLNVLVSHPECVSAVFARNIEGEGDADSH